MFLVTATYTGHEVENADKMLYGVTRLTRYGTEKDADQGRLEVCWLIPRWQFAVSVGKCCASLPGMRAHLREATTAEIRGT